MKATNFKMWTLTDEDIKQINENGCCPRCGIKLRPVPHEGKRAKFNCGECGTSYYIESGGTKQ